MTFLKPYKKRMIVIIVCGLLANVDSIVNALYLQVLIDRYISPMLQTGSQNFTPLLYSIVTMGVIYLLGVVVSFMSEYLIIPVVQGVLRDIREQMFVRMQSLPLEYFDNNKFGDIMSLYTNDTDTLEQMIGRTIPNMAMSLSMIAMVLGVMLYTNLWLTLLTLSVIAVMLLLSGQILRLSGKFFMRQQQALAATNAYIEEMINGQKVIKVFVHEKTGERDFAKLNDELAESNRKANSLANLLMPMMVQFGNLQYVLIAIVGGVMAVNGFGGITLGLIASFMQLGRNLSRPINNMSQQLNFLAMALAGATRIFALMDQHPELDEGKITLVNCRQHHGKLVETKVKTRYWAWKKPLADGGSELIPLQGAVRFNHVSFAYEKGKPVLRDISFFAEPGQKIAFVGHTGAGKTTITNLLNRFYDVEEGEILYDGINVKEIKKADLRRSLGMILQDTSLFTTTVAQNVAYGRLDADEKQIKRAIAWANATEMVNSLPQGVKTVIDGSGTDLSQGQRQLLSIARTAISDPPVMIMDEATSSIDTRTEKIIQDAFDKLMKQRTTLVIAHRLSTVRSSRAIMVMDHGRIIESGSHEKLLAQKGIYYQLYTGAFELE
ncbi:ABC transporter ATP-binding protein [bacterium]|nr:ABC transporter ATP-binding protein [bacterium]